MATLPRRMLHARLVEARSAHSLVRLWSRKLHSRKKQQLYTMLLVQQFLRERETLLDLDLSSHSMVVPRQLLGITTKIPSTYSAAKTMVLSLLLQRFWKTTVLLQILLLQVNRITVQLSILLPHIHTEQSILLVSLRLQERKTLLDLDLYSPHLVQSKLLLLITNRLIYSLSLVQLHSADLETLLDLDPCSLSVVVSRKSPSIITTIQFLYTQELITVLLPTLLQQLQMMDLSPVL